MGSRYPQHTLQLLCKRAERAGPKDASESCAVRDGHGLHPKQRVRLLAPGKT